MSDIIHLGTPGAIEQPSSTGSDPRTGASTTRRFHGKPADLFPLIQQFSAAGYVVQFTPITPVTYELTATAGYAWSGSGVTDNPVDVWDITSTRTEKDLLSVDIPIINGLSQSDKDLIRSTLVSAPATVPTTLTGNALQVYQDMRDGFDHYPVYAPILRHTQTVSCVNTQQSSLVGVTKIYSTASMLSNQGVPKTLNVDLSAIEGLYTNNKTGYAYGWYKEFPNITIAANCKTQIHQDFIYGLYPVAYFTSPL